MQQKTPKLGTLIDAAESRDAIHIAVAPAVAVGDLAPGQRVGIVGGAADSGDVSVGVSDNPIGIVDPYLANVVRNGQRFWMCLFPETVTSLRHEWTHPAFSAQAIPPAHRSEASASATWLRDFAAQVDVDYDEMMNAAGAYWRVSSRGGYPNYICEGDKYQGVHVTDEFWEKFQEVTGDKVPEAHRGTFFSCSC